MIILHIHSSRSVLYGCVVRLGWSRMEPRSEGSILEMSLNVLKGKLGADQRQTHLMSVRIHLSSFGEVVSKCDQIANMHWIIEKAGEFQKNTFFCFIDYAKAFDCMDHNKLWKILQEIGIPDHRTRFLWNLYAGQEATVSTGHGTMEQLKLGKEYFKGAYCHPVYITYM